MTHWTTTVYREHGHLMYDVEAAIFQNDILTDFEMSMLGKSAAQIGGAVGSPLLDLACGPGRHSRRFAQEGLAVTGIDLSESFLGIGRAVSLDTAHGQRPHFACGDMRHLPIRDGCFRTVVLLGNSFGYFPEEQNLDVLCEAHRTLAPGGFFCMEITDRDAYLPNLRPFERERIQSRAFGELESSWTKSWDPATRRVHTWERHCRLSTGEVLYEGAYDLRLYGRDEIGQLLRAADFRAVGFHQGSPRELALAEGLGETLGAAGQVLFVGALT